MRTNPSMPDDRRPFSVPQLAERWGCSQGLVRKLIRDGRLQCFRPGALIRISAAEVESTSDMAL
jgi:excisionase family DNA binding protein